MTSSAPAFNKEKVRQIPLFSLREQLLIHSFTYPQEIAEGKLLVDAAHAANVQLFVWSGLPNVIENSGGKYTTVIHFDAKAEVTKYAKELGIPFVNVQAGSYMSNYLHAGVRKLPDGSYMLASVQAPDGVLPLLDTQNDYGLFVRRAIEEPGLAGSEIYAFGEEVTMTELVKQFSEGMFLALIVGSWGPEHSADVQPDYRHR